MCLLFQTNTFSYKYILLDSVFILPSYFYLASKPCLSDVIFTCTFLCLKKPLISILKWRSFMRLKILLNHTVTIALFDLLFFYSQEPDIRRSVMKIPTNEKSQILIDWNRLNVSFSSIDPLLSSHTIPHKIKTLPQETKKDPKKTILFYLFSKLLLYDFYLICMIPSFHGKPMK